MQQLQTRQFLLWFHHCLIVITQIGDWAFLAARALVDTNALPMAQQGLVEVVDGAGFLWKQGLQEIVGSVGCDFLADETQAVETPHTCVSAGNSI